MSSSLPEENEVLEYFSSLSNWGRWGVDDEVGTLNLVTDAKRAQAARLVRLGRVVSCAWDIETGHRPDDVGAPPQRYMLGTGQGLGDPARVPPPGAVPGDRQAGATEFLGMAYHGYRITHLDALSHISWDARMYNDRPAELVTVAHGATVLDVRRARTGIVTRGILLDAAGHRGIPWLEPDEFVTPAEVGAMLASRDLRAEAGDALLLRTGYGRKLLERGPDALGAGHAGWHASCLPWLHRNGIALIAADHSVDAVPSGYPHLRTPVHAIGISTIGIWLMDCCDLEPLAVACEELGTWEFQFVVAPLPFTGATGSPVNPLALF
ncbi:MAG TPA: cyclase family protein [Acidimicrobiales bacterium]|nr:cyclase family protein [Acidimicrobiales bacterium]